LCALKCCQSIQSILVGQTQEIEQQERTDNRDEAQDSVAKTLPLRPQIDQAKKKTIKEITNIGTN
jgi:hypothetical protein